MQFSLVTVTMRINDSISKLDGYDRATAGLSYCEILTKTFALKSCSFVVVLTLAWYSSFSDMPLVSYIIVNTFVFPSWFLNECSLALWNEIGHNGFATLYSEIGAFLCFPVPCHIPDIHEIYPFEPCYRSPFVSRPRTTWSERRRREGDNYYLAQPRVNDSKILFTKSSLSAARTLAFRGQSRILLNSNTGDCLHNCLEWPLLTSTLQVIQVAQHYLLEIQLLF